MLIFFVLGKLYYKNVSLDHDIPVTLAITNPSGEDWFQNMVYNGNYDTNHAAIVVYDITERCSFEKAKMLVDGCTDFTRPGAFVALVGNKADLESGREVSFKVSNVIMFI